MTPILVVAALTLGPSPPPSPAPTPLADPCGSILSIVTRPTVTTSVCTVRTGSVLVENGYADTVTTGPGAGVTVTYPQSLVRIGTFDPHLEADVIVPSFNRSSLSNASASGWSDFGMGAKTELGYGARWLYGVSAAVTYPTGSRAFSAGNAQFTGNFNWSYSVNSVVGLSGTMSFNALSGLNASAALQSYFAFIPSLELSAAVPGGPSQISAEYAYYSATGPGLRSKNLVDFIYQRDFGNNLQFDAEYGRSPTLVNGQASHYLGAGLSFMN